jgi:PhnB protein
MAEEQGITPMMSFEDGAAAIEWLCDAFGFEEIRRMAGEDGTIGHAELRLEGARIFLASPTPDYRGPRRHAEACDDARRWREVPYVIDGLHVRVSDVDAHFRGAKEAGATILSEPEDEPYGERIYRVEDIEGHRWMFAQPIEVDPAG